LVQSIDYDSFGKAIVTGSPSTRYLYTGRELDVESGLFYYRARYYDTSNGRFTNEDPIGFAGGSWNTQIYVDNSPIAWIDPMGLSGVDPNQGILWPSYADKTYRDPSVGQLGANARSSGDAPFKYDGSQSCGQARSCPASEKDIIGEGDNWRPYHGDLDWFHRSGRSGYKENKLPNEFNPQGECIYDENGDPVGGWVGGSPNEHDSEESPWAHTFNDGGGPFSKNGAAGLVGSLIKWIRGS
jgi:RHS repeat-associated protein